MTRVPRTAVWAVVIAVSLAWVIAPGPATAQSAPAEPLELSGVGTWAAAGPALTWAEALFEAPSPTQVGFLTEGSLDARRSFLRGGTQFLISGTPFTESEQAELDAADLELIDLPIQGVGLALLASGPYPRGLTLCRPGPGEDDPTLTDCYPEGRFQGPLRLNPEDVVDIVLETGRNNWANPAFQDLMPPDLDLVVPIQPAAPVVRSDGGATNKFLQQYLASVDPTRWAAKTAAEGRPGLQPDESWPFLGTPSKSGLPTVTQVVSSWLAPSSTSSVVGGVLAPTSPLAAVGALITEGQKPDGAIRTDLWIPQLKNGAGEWVNPTASAISTSIAAGEGEPLYGLTHPVPGAWPITWVNRMYAPATGLSGDQANALATLIRWQVTVGQGVSEQLGDGRLTAAMVEESLAKADEIVRSNCAAAGLSTEKGDAGGRYAPKGSLDGLGKVEHCITGTAPPTPTTVPDEERVVPAEVEDTMSFSDSFFDDYYSPDFSYADGSFTPLSELVATASGGGAGALAGVPSPQGGSDGVAAATEIVATGSMPLPLPGDDFGQMDRLATLALGAGLFLLGRSMLRRRSGVPT